MGVENDVAMHSMFLSCRSSLSRTKMPFGCMGWQTQKTEWQLASFYHPPGRERAVPAGLLGGTTEGGAKTSVEEIIIPHFHHFGGFRLEFFMST